MICIWAISSPGKFLPSLIDLTNEDGCVRTDRTNEDRCVRTDLTNEDKCVLTGRTNWNGASASLDRPRRPLQLTSLRNFKQSPRCDLKKHSIYSNVTAQNPFQQTVHRS